MLIQELQCADNLPSNTAVRGGVPRWEGSWGSRRWRGACQNSCKGSLDFEAVSTVRNSRTSGCKAIQSIRQHEARLAGAQDQGDVLRMYGPPASTLCLHHLVRAYLASRHAPAHFGQLPPSNPGSGPPRGPIRHQSNPLDTAPQRGATSPVGLALLTRADAVQRQETSLTSSRMRLGSRDLRRATPRSAAKWAASSRCLGAV